MECLACGSDNQEDSQFCRRCGTRFSATQVTSSTPQEMDTKVQEAPSPATIPEDAIIALQSWWAYMLPSTVPLLILSGLVFFILTFGILPIVIGFSVIGYRYLVFRRTAYILTEKHLVILQGSLMAQNRIDVPFADLNNILVQPGMFGRSVMRWLVWRYLTPLGSRMNPSPSGPPTSSQRNTSSSSRVH